MTIDDPDKFEIQSEQKWKKKFEFHFTFNSGDGEFYVAVLKGPDDDYGFRREFLKYTREWTSRSHYSHIFNFEIFPGEVVETGKKSQPNKSYYVCTPDGILSLIAHVSETYDGKTSNLLWDYISGKVPLEILLKKE